jgi:hypothetical protein
MNISPEVRLNEALAMIAFLESRNLVLAQSGVKMTSERNTQIKELQDRIAELEAQLPSEPLELTDEKELNNA